MIGDSNESWHGFVGRRVLIWKPKNVKGLGLQSIFPRYLMDIGEKQRPILGTMRKLQDEPLCPAVRVA